MKSYSKIFPFILAFAVNASLGVCPAPATTIRFYEDPRGDASRNAAQGTVVDFKNLTIERKASNKIEIKFQTDDTFPKSPKNECAFIMYFDLDNNGQTGKPFNEAGLDMDVVVFKMPSMSQWQSKIDRYSIVVANDKIEVSKISFNGDTGTIVLTSNLFKKIDTFTFYAEFIVNKSNIIDRIPDTGTLKW